MLNHPINWDTIRQYILQSSIIAEQPRPAVTGWSDGSLSTTGRPNFIRVRFYDDNTEAEVYNESIPLVSGIQVRVYKGTDGVLRARYPSSNYKPSDLWFSFVKNHSFNHSTYSVDPLYIQTRAFLPMQPNISGPWTVSVNPGWAVIGDQAYWYAGETISVADYRPTTGGRFVLLTSGLVDVGGVNTVKMIVTLGSVKETLVAPDDFPNIPTGTTPICAVRVRRRDKKLQDKQTDGDMHDLRLSGGSTGSSDMSSYIKLDGSNGPITGQLVFDPSTDTQNIKVVKETGNTQNAFALFMGSNPNPVAYIDPNGSANFANLSGSNTGDASIASADGTIMPISSGQNIDLSVVPSAIAHNDLGSKQGGTAGEYYHLSSAQATVVGNTSGVNTGDQNLSNYLKLDGSNDPITGDLKLTPTADSTSVFQVFKSGGTTNVFNVDTTNSRIGILTATPSYTFSIGPEATRTIQIERRSAANTAGNTLVLQAGGATALATDKAGGTLQLNGGLSTGTGSSTILLRTYTPGTTGTADNVLATRATINNSGLAVSGVLSVTSTTATTGTVLTIGGTTPVDNGTVLDMIATLSGTGSLLGLNIRPNYSNVGTGATVMGAAFGPNINSPTGTVTTMYGMLFIPRLNTDSSVAVTNAYGMYVRLDNVSTATPVSTVARYEGIHLAVPYGNNKPTVSYSIVIDDQAGDLVLGDGNDILLGSTTGTKIGITTTEKLGFFGTTPVVRGTAFDQTNYSATSHTHAAVAQLAAPAGGTGTAAGGWDTAANRNLAITSINAARTDIANVKQVLNALIDELQALGLIA